MIKIKVPIPGPTTVNGGAVKGSSSHLRQMCHFNFDAPIEVKGFVQGL